METKNYSSDSPIYDQEHDRFSRWGFSDRIAQVISRRSDPSSIVIGLYGIWGDGKTSVLNFIEKSLERDQNVICIKFNPWRFGTEEELLTGFFFDIAHALDAKLIKTGDKLKDLIKKVAPSAGAILGSAEAGNAIGSFISGPDINELKKRIESELENAKKRILILIDDVDRLDKTEIHALFRLVKLTADFKYTSYILAFDKNVVSASLQDRYSNSAGNAGEAFLEKIIQVPLHLPAVEKRVLREFCFHGVDEALDIAGIKLNDQQVQEFVREFSNAFDDCLTTPRKAKLYGNILMFSLPILQGEINPVDLMLVEGIRVFCPSLYDVLRNNKSLFSGTFKNSPYSNNDIEKSRLRTLIDDTLNSCININKEGLINLLKNMFPKLQSVYGNMNYDSDWHEKWYKAKRVCSENYYSRYFTYSIPANDISDSSIQIIIEQSALWKKPFELEQNPLNHILTSTSAETLIKKLRYKAGEIFESTSVALAIAVAQKCDVIPNPEVLYGWSAPFSQAAMLISQLIQNLDKKQRTNLAKTCINIAPSLAFKIEIFKWLNREDDNKPEKDAFPEAEINDIGNYLGNAIADVLECSVDITTLYPKALPTIFYTLNKFVREDYVNKYVSTLISKSPVSIISILDAYVPTAWGIESGISHKSDFERDQYENLVRVLDPSIIVEAIETNYPTAMKKLDEYPIYYDDNAEKGLLFLEQFIWLHRYVLHESQKSDGSNKTETQA